MTALRKPGKPKDRRTAEEQLADLREQAVAARMRVRDAEAALATAGRVVAEARQSRVEAHAASDQQRVGELDVVVADATAGLAGLEDAVAGAELSAKRAMDAIVRFTTAHVSDLIGERAAADRAAAVAVGDALEHVVSAARAWEARASASMAIARDAESEHPGSVPSLPLDDVLRAVRQALSSSSTIPAPSVRGVSTGGWSIEPTHSPDDIEREAARAAAEAA